MPRVNHAGEMTDVTQLWKVLLRVFIFFAWQTFDVLNLLYGRFSIYNRWVDLFRIRHGNQWLLSWLMWCLISQGFIEHTKFIWPLTLDRKLPSSNR